MQKIIFRLNPKTCFSETVAWEKVNILQVNCHNNFTAVGLSEFLLLHKIPCEC